MSSRVQPTSYIGLSHTQHDPALAIVDSHGDVVFAQATERHTGVKRALNMPPDDLWTVHETVRRYCEPGARLVVAMTWPRDRARMQRLLRRVYDAADPAPLRWLDRIERATRTRFRSEPRAAIELLLGTVEQAQASVVASSVMVGKNLALRLRSDLSDQFPSSLERRAYPHHHTHAAAACYSSPFERAACAVIDGFGDRGSTGFYAYRDGRIDPLRDSRTSSASLGEFYQTLCHFCGFDGVRGEEWKVMGLAGYGKRDARVYDLCHALMRVDGLQLEPARTRWLALYELSKMRRRAGTPAIEYADFAFTAQEVFCDLSAALLCNLHRLGLSDDLVVGGGTSLNSSWNGSIVERTPFKRVHAFCAPGDDGNAVGAALLAYYEDHPEAKPAGRVMTPYLGDCIAPTTIRRAIELGGLAPTPLGEVPVHRRVAELLAAGKLVGWVQGRAEFGPRALGNRSILADARSAHVKDRLNERVKFREEFRPFAPSILHEHGPAYFENYQESPYMERTLRFRPEVRSKVPGAVHVDGTGRLQTVKPGWNARYHALLSAFYDLTGIPLILNTSFNVMGRPIVHSVEDALAVFFTSGLDVLVLEDHVFEKRPS